jgi:hypothetical protein
VTNIQISARLAGEIEKSPERFRPPVVRGQEVVAFAGERSTVARIGRVERIGLAGYSIYFRSHSEPMKHVLAQAWAPVGSKDDAADADTRPVKGGRVLDLHAPVYVHRAVIVEQTYVAGPIGIVHPDEGSTLTADWALLPEALTLDDEGASPQPVEPLPPAPRIAVPARPPVDPFLQQREIERLDRELAEARAALAAQRRIGVNNHRAGRITALRELAADLGMAGEDRHIIELIENRIAALEAKTDA